MLLTMAVRNVFRNRKRSLLTGITMVGGFVLMATTIALVEGSYGQLIDVFTGQYTGHVQLSHPQWAEGQSLVKTLRTRQGLVAKLSADPQVKSVAPRIHGGSLVYYGTGTFGAQLVGIDPEREQKATSYSLRITEGKAFNTRDAYEAIVGKAIAKVLDIPIGGDIILISQGADGSIANDIFKVVGIMGGEMEGRDDYRIYLPIAAAAEFFTLQGRYHELAVLLHDADDAQGFAASLTNIVPTQQQRAPQPREVEAQPWQVVERDFYRTMQIDKQGHRFTFCILMVIIGVGILNTILMSTLERTREFGVLKAMGTLPRTIFGLVVIESLALALMAIAAAIVLAWATISILSVHGISFEEPLKVAGMVIEEHRARLVLEAFTAPAATVLVTTLIASLYPAQRAAKLSVADCLRDY